MTGGIPNCLRSSCVTPSVRMAFSTPTGLSVFNLAVRRTVMIRDTFLLPCSHLFPNMIFRKITELRKPCSDLLLERSNHKIIGEFKFEINRKSLQVQL